MTSAVANAQLSLFSQADYKATEAQHWDNVQRHRLLENVRRQFAEGRKVAVIERNGDSLTLPEVWFLPCRKAAEWLAKADYAMEAESQRIPRKLWGFRLPLPSKLVEWVKIWPSLALA